MLEGNLNRKLEKDKWLSGKKEERQIIKNYNVKKLLSRIQSFVRSSPTRNVYVLTILDRIDDSPVRRLARSWFNRGLVSMDGQYTFKTVGGGRASLRVIDIRKLTNIPHSQLLSYVHVHKDGEHDIHYRKEMMEMVLRLVASQVEPSSMYCYFL